MKELDLKDSYDTLGELFEDFCSKNEARWYLDYLVQFSRECDTVLEYGTWQGQRGRKEIYGRQLEDCCSG